MPRYDYEEVRRSVERVRWDVEDVCEGSLDFRHPFLPDSMAGTAGAPLSSTQALLLNQIRGYGYLRMSALAEGVILPFVPDHARSRLRHEPARLRALLGLASLEAKHLVLFHRLAAAFDRDFGVRCDVVGPQEALAREVLRHPPLTIALTVLHIEEAAAAHQAAARHAPIEACFALLFEHHHVDACHHAQVITNVVQELAEECTSRERGDAVEGYLEVVDYLDAALGRQVELDLESLRRATRLEVEPDRLATLRDTQLAFQRHTYLGSGMTAPRFEEVVESLGEDLAGRVRRVSANYR